MILIADSGSTKTDWRLIADDQKITQAQSLGFNPNYESGEFIKSVQAQVLPKISSPAKEIHFYGAGISTNKNHTITKEVLHTLFPEATIFANHDVLAAARALCGHDPGIACILGTGSNACLYDGVKTTSRETNLGYIMGDEGSGYHLGKSLVTAYIHQELPDELMRRFAKRYPQVNRVNLLEHLYHQPYPNRYLAGFTKFLFDYRQQPVIYRMVYECFSIFFDRYVTRLDNNQSHSVHFVGSVAFYFSDILRQVANDKNHRAGNILETPIAGLTLFHQQQLQ
ncbi:MAG TPA: N-acetylglucosamine kinase [Microscillaceae bacterium]|nr:N-acetylglucosamine kinase [Microscillaceae bacterium]